MAYRQASTRLRFPGHFPLVAGTWTNTTAGSDGAGAYALAGAADVQGDQFAVVSGALHYAKIRMGGSPIQNQVVVNYFDSGRAYLSNQVTFVFSSAGYTATVTPARDWVVSFTPPSTAAYANLEFPALAGRNLRVYGRTIIPASSMVPAPLCDLPIPFKGLSYQKLGTNLTWAGDASVTAGQIEAFLQGVVAGGAHGFRIWVGLDCGLTFDGGGIPTGILPQCLANMTMLATLAQECGLAVVPCLFTPLDFTAASDFRRAAMTSAAVLAGYQAVCTRLAQYLEALPAIVAWDLCNEPHYFMTTNADGTGSYSADQINAVLAAISAGLRAGTSKPLVLGAADGPSAVVCFAGCDPAIYDVADMHTYNATGLMPGSAYQPQCHKPLVALEFGPPVATTDPQITANAAIPLLYAASANVSAAYAWIDFVTQSPAFAAEIQGF